MILVIQSYKPLENGIPLWIHHCMQTVRAWAHSAGHEYLFYGDDFFDFLPDVVRHDLRYDFYPLLDLVRLYALREHLNTGDYEAVMWIDADVVIFDPESFVVPTENALCRERVLMKRRDDLPYEIAPDTTNNAVMIFYKNNDFLLHSYLKKSLDYIYATLKKDVEAQQLSRCALGTELLDREFKGQSKLFMNVGLFNTIYLDLLFYWQNRKYLFGCPPPLVHYSALYGRNKIAAANICHSNRLAQSSPINILGYDYMMEQIVKELVDTKGQMVNWGK